MKPLKNKWLELVIVFSAPLLSVIDVFIINVAITARKGRGPFWAQEGVLLGDALVHRHVCALRTFGNTVLFVGTAFGDRGVEADIFYQRTDRRHDVDRDASFINNQKKKLRENRNPLIDVRLFRIRDFNIGLLAVLFHFMLHTSYLLLSAVYLQNGLGKSAIQCGLYFVVPGILFMVSSVAASKLIIRLSIRHSSRRRRRLVSASSAGYSFISRGMAGRPLTTRVY